MSAMDWRLVRRRLAYSCELKNVVIRLLAAELTEAAPFALEGCGRCRGKKSLWLYQLAVTPVDCKPGDFLFSKCKANEGFVLR